MFAAIYLFTLAFIAGNLFLHSFAELPHVYWYSLAPVAVLMFCKQWWKRGIGAFCAGFFWTLWVASGQGADHLESGLEGQVIEITGRVHSIPIPQVDALRFDLEVLEAPNGSQKFPKLLALKIYQRYADIRASDVLRAHVKLKRPYGYANPDTFDYQKWLFMRGMGATGYVKSYQLLERSHSWLDLNYLRQQLFDRLAAHQAQYAQVYSIAAITLGLGQLLTHQQREILSATGTYHLFAVSGLHVGLVFGFFFLLIGAVWRLFFLHRFLYPTTQVAVLGALPPAVIYALLAGFSIPTQRALIMLSCFVVAGVAKQRIALTQSFCIALLLVLLHDPLATLSISFWLSFSAVALIILFLSIFPVLTGWSRWLSLQVYISVAMILPTLLFFMQGAVIAPLANLVSVPLTAFLILPLSLLAVAALVFSEALAFPFLYSADWLFARLWQINQWLAAHTASWFQYIDEFAFGLALLALVLFLTIRIFSLRVVALLLLLPLFNSASLPPEAGAFRVVFFDVGQGVSVLLRTHRHTLLYDTGPSYRSGFNIGDAVILPYLRAQNISVLDKLLISHADNDHVGSAERVAQQVDVRRLLSGEVVTVGGQLSEPCYEGQAWQWDGVSFEILHPPRDHLYSGNDASCVLRISNRVHSLLLTADIEKRAERVLLKHRARLPSDVMLIPHHGSRTSSTPDFISAVSPAIAVVTTGYRNHFGFPKLNIVRRYYERGITILNTAQSGALIFDFPAAGSLDIKAHRMEARHHWRKTPYLLSPSAH